MTKTSMRIYITHCSATKDDTLKHSHKRVTPDRLYTSSRTQRFMKRCLERGVEWAILSDRYGIWFPSVEHEWYEKHPNTVTDQEFQAIVDDFDRRLAQYDEIYFYYHPGRLHKLYSEILESTRIKNRIIRFIHVNQIE